MHLLGISTPTPWPTGLFSSIVFPSAGVYPIQRDEVDIFDYYGLR